MSLHLTPEKLFNLLSGLNEITTVVLDEKNDCGFGYDRVSNLRGDFITSDYEETHIVLNRMEGSEVRVIDYSPLITLTITDDVHRFTLSGTYKSNKLIGQYINVYTATFEKKHIDAIVKVSELIGLKEL